MSAETSFRNAHIVLFDEIICGTLNMRDGKIACIDAGAGATGTDLEGDYLIPGLVELHTDHLEGHFAPRPGVRWNTIAAVQAHDAQIATSGITTVFDCLRLGSGEDVDFVRGEMRMLADAIEQASAQQRLRADHFIHLRCEVSSSDVIDDLEDFHDDQQVRLASLMDHAPGQRQFQTMEQYTLYYKTKRGMTDEEFDRFVAIRKEQSERYAAPNRKKIAEYCRQKGITLASHDDATLAHVDEALGDGVRLAEFPTTFEAAQASHNAGLSVLMGAPNIVRNGSHSGNIAARQLAEAGVLDVLSSDYVPASLLHGAFKLAEDVETITLPQALRLVTDNPAQAAGLHDRGSISQDRRADLVRVRWKDGIPMVRGVWREGVRVA